MLDYRVEFRKPTRVSALKVDLSGFYRDSSGDVSNRVSYYEYIGASKRVSNRVGLAIDVGIQEGVEYVDQLHYFPREDDAKSAECRTAKKHRKQQRP